MPSAPYLSAEGKRSELELSPELFDAQVNVPVMHEVVRAQLAGARSGTHATKNRGDVRGGGRKPWRQKGTGRARQGSRRSPQWVGGGIAHGPTPRDHSMRINKKVRALALRSALTDRAREGKVVVVDLPRFEEPDTKQGLSLLGEWGAEGNRILLIFGRDEAASESLTNVVKSFRNLPEVLMVSYPTAYSVLNADTVIFTKVALEELSTIGGSGRGRSEGRSGEEGNTVGRDAPEASSENIDEGSES